MTVNLPIELLNQSMIYAENNFIDDKAKHLHVDKAFIRKNFDLNGKKILDFGSGMGGMSLWYAQNWDCQVHGVDIDGQHVAIANALKEKHHAYNTFFEKRDITRQPLPAEMNGTFDVIFMNDVAEHIPYPLLDKIFSEFYRLLSPKGRIFVSYPPWQSPYASHVTRITHLPWCQFLPQKLLLKWIEKKNVKISGEHESDLLEAYKGLNRLTHDKLMDVTEKAGFRVRRRLSHSLIRKLPILRGINPNVFPLKYLVSKEIVVLIR
jgi:2-polyprenyl-3-methyl-5-hydroxy-6-metoxy-1,4-benzoquinol methylase